MTNSDYEHARRTNGIPWKTKPCRECNREKPSDTVFCGVCDECAEEQEKQRLEAKAAWARQMEAEARMKRWREPPAPACRICGLAAALLDSKHHEDGTHTHNSCAAQAKR